MAGKRGTTHGIGSVRAARLTPGALAALWAAALVGGPVQASPEAVAIKLAAPGAWAYVDDTGKVRPSGSFTGVPPDGSLTAEGLKQRQSFDFKTDDPVLGCGEPGMPRALTAASPMTFAWQDDSLVIKYESMDVTRTVHMHELMVPEGTPRSPNGYSRGFWDGDTLVVETTRLDDRIQDLQGTPKSESVRLVERYRVDEQNDETYLRVDLTMIDDKIFAKPYEWHLDFVNKPDWSLLEYACEERPQELTPGVVPDEAGSPPTSFEDLDTDGDGLLTLEEFSKYPPATGPGRTPDRPFRLQDTNGDGYVSYREFAHRRGPRFASLDRDSDGLLTTRELAQLPQDMLAAIALDKLDENGDARLSVEEFAKSGPRWESLPASDPAARLTGGVWLYVNGQGEVVPAGGFTGLIPSEALTDAGKQRIAAFDWRHDDPLIECGPPGMPRALDPGSPMDFRWDGDRLVIRYESNDVVRTVHKRGASARPVESIPLSPYGYAEWHWDGDELVIDTSRIEHGIVNLQGMPKSDGMRLEERYAVTDADRGRELALTLVMTDPVMYRHPITKTMTFLLDADGRIEKYDCVPRPDNL